MMATIPGATGELGFKAVPVQTLLADHEVLLARIKLCYGADRAAFEQELMPAVRGYAAYVHLLPATPDSFFDAPGGLLRLGLETAFFSLQGTDAHIFSGRATILERRELEPRWRIATFIAGLCCELHRAIGDVVVTSADGSRWPAFVMPLADWLRQHEVDRYFVRWRPKASESRSSSLFALPLAIHSSTLQHLCHDDGAIVRQLLASIGGVRDHREPNVLDDLVRRSLALVVDRNLASDAERAGSPRQGLHVERDLIHAMRRLAASHSAWVANRDKGRLWYAQDGLYLVWPGAAEDIIGLLDRDQLAGVPKSASALLDLFVGAGVAQRTTDGSATWTIVTPGAKLPVQAIRLASPSVVFIDGDRLPDQLPSPLHREGSEQPSSPSPAPTLPAEPGSQLSLIEPAANDMASVVAEPAASPSMPAEPRARSIRLNAPMRLNPAVGRCMAALIDGLNDPPGTDVVLTVAEGVFIALAEFERRGIEPTIALRALSDAAMLVRPARSGPPTVSRDVCGTSTVGLIIRSAHIAGLDPAAFLAATGAA